MKKTKTPPFGSNYYNNFRVLDAAYSLISALAPVVAAVGRHDRSLRDQLRRAGSSIPLNLAEGYGLEFEGEPPAAARELPKSSLKEKTAVTRSSAFSRRSVRLGKSPPSSKSHGAGSTSRQGPQAKRSKLSTESRR